MATSNAKKQREILVELLNRGKTITVRQARTKYGIKSLSARIFEVRNIDRLPVQVTHRRVNGETQAVYFL